MMFRRSVLATNAIVLGVLTVAACGSDRLGLPTSPSSAPLVPSADQPVIAAADTSGYVITSLVPGTSCPTLQFKIQTYVIKTDTTTRYDGGSCTSLQAGSKLTALSGSRPNNNEQVLYATQITIQSSTPAPAPTPAPGAPAPVTTPPAKPVTPAPAPVPVPVSFETTVTVSSVVAGSACPYREFMVGGYRLTTSRATRYENGTCANIAPGVTLGIVATKGSVDTSVLVSTVTFKHESQPDTTPTDEVATLVTVDSVVTGSTCPAISFLVGPYTVTASSTTHYESGMCTDIKPGAVLYLTGMKQGDDHVLASRVAFPG